MDLENELENTQEENESNSNGDLAEAVEPGFVCFPDSEAAILTDHLINCIGRDTKDKIVVNDVLNDKKETIQKLIRRAKDIFQQESSLLEIEPPINICGDIHGQFYDLLRLFQLCGRPPEQKFLFLGDYVDRGPHSLETICLLLLYKVQFTDRIYLLRGNHECSTINLVYGFHDECEERYKGGELLWNSFQEMFEWLPFAARIGKRILCMHGGISPYLKDLSDITNILRPVNPFKEPVVQTDLLWADPDPSMPNGPTDPEYGENLVREIGHYFSEKAILNTCRRLKLDLVVRAHQVVMDGYQFFANRHLVTVFSAPNYMGNFGNRAAVLTIDVSHKCSFRTIPPLTFVPCRRKRMRSEIDIDDMLGEFL